MISNSTKMVEVGNAGSLPLTCKNKSCKKNIGILEKYFIDTLWDRDYCHQCGICLRYARRKALERGEIIENVEI